MDFMTFWKALNEAAAFNGLREPNYGEVRDLYEDASADSWSGSEASPYAIAILAGMHKGRVEAEAYAAH